MNDVFGANIRAHSRLILVISKGQILMHTNMKDIGHLSIGMLPFGTGGIYSSTDSLFLRANSNSSKQ